MTFDGGWAGVGGSYGVLVLVMVGLVFGSGVERARGAAGEVGNGEDWAVVVGLNARRVAEHPEDGEAWENLMRAQMELNDFARAEKTLKNWRVKVGAPKAVNELLEGQLALDEEDAARAVKVLEGYLKKAPKDDAGWRTLASAYGAEKDWRKAVESMGSVLAIKADAEGFVQRARWRMQMRDWAGAESDIREANRRDATNVDVQALYPVFERASTWRPKMQALDEAVKSHPEDGGALLDRAEWLRWNGLKDLAKEDIEAAFRMNPKSLRARVWFGLAQDIGPNGEVPRDLSGDDRKIDTEGVMPMPTQKITPEFARELKALDAGNDAEARAQFLLRYDQPLVALREAQDTDGSPAKAQALLDLDRLPEAGRAARRATQVHPDSAPAWLALGRWELKSGNDREAMEAAQRSDKLHKSADAEALRKAAQQRLGK